MSPFGNFGRRIAAFGARALSAVPRFGTSAGNFLNQGSTIGQRVAAMARSGVNRLEQSDFSKTPGVLGESLGCARDAANIVDGASKAAGRPNYNPKKISATVTTPAINMKALPNFFNYIPRPVAPSAEMIRHYITPRSASSFEAGSKIEFDIPAGTPGLHLDPSQTVLSFTIKNDTYANITLDSGAHSVFQAIEIRFSMVILFRATTLAEIKLAPALNWGVYDAAPTTGKVTVSSAKLHISQVRIDGSVERSLMSSLGGIVHIPTLDYSHFSTTVAPATGAISFNIPIRVSSATNLFVTLRPTSNLEKFDKATISERIKAAMSAIICTGFAADARMEPSRIFGGVADAAARSSVSSAQYSESAFAIGLSLQAFPTTDALSDGMSTCNQHIIFEATIDNNNVGLRLNAFLQHEKLLVAQVANAKIRDASGLYIIRPRWAKRRALYKFGLTKNITRRLYSGYRHSFPVVADSFEIVAFIKVHPSHVFARERRLMQLSRAAYGFVKPDNDLEWREYKRPQKQLEANLMRAVRTQVTFRGGREPSVQQDNTVPLGANVTTRAAAGSRNVINNAALTPNRDELHIRQLRGKKTVRS
ncbi:hypothetical protein T492DRAFT_1128628 [Pavlovales sp. CCMP2436]|nr:hypothetical protein T492DRAFT_1128628 [Pavlovales sp. CCMP2436]